MVNLSLKGALSVERRLFPSLEHGTVHYVLRTEAKGRRVMADAGRGPLSGRRALVGAVECRLACPIESLSAKAPARWIGGGWVVRALADNSLLKVKLVKATVRDSFQAWFTIYRQWQ